MATADRWSSVSCSMCCLMDVNADGFLTLEEMMVIYTAFCGNDDEQVKGEHASDNSTSSVTDKAPE